MNREEALEIINGIERHLANQGMTDEEYSLDEALVTLGVYKQPDPITGLVPCGCGGEVYPHYQLGWYHEESGVQAFEVSTGCDGCGTYTKPLHGHYVNGIDEDDTELASKRDWNISHGYTDPPRPGAIVPSAL